MGHIITCVHVTHGCYTKGNNDFVMSHRKNNVRVRVRVKKPGIVL